MLYSIAGSSAVQPMQVADRRPRYRRPARAGNRAPKAAAVPTKQAEMHVRSRDQGARWERILSLSARLSATLSDEARATWLALEELIHGHWLDVSVELYNKGFDAGAAQSQLRSELGDRAYAREKLCAIAEALLKISAELDVPSPKS